MKHTGQARRAALKLILLTLLGVGVLAFIAKGVNFLPALIIGALGGIWFLFVLFTLYFFRDPNARTPIGPGLVVSPGHGKVDFVDRIEKSDYMGGPCHRISIFLSVIDIHVQNAPVSGKVSCVTHTAGQFLSALGADSAVYNE